MEENKIKCFENEHVNEKCQQDSTNFFSGLMIACHRNAIETAKVFIEKGSEINSVDAEGMTPVHFAAQAGVNFTKQSEQSRKPLTYIAEKVRFYISIKFKLLFYFVHDTLFWHILSYTLTIKMICAKVALF